MLKVVIIPTTLATSRGRLTNIDGKQASQEVVNRYDSQIWNFHVILRRSLSRNVRRGCPRREHRKTKRHLAREICAGRYIDVDGILNFSELAENSKLIDIDEI
jgi:hypothetical protein